MDNFHGKKPPLPKKHLALAALATTTLGAGAYGYNHLKKEAKVNLNRLAKTTAEKGKRWLKEPAGQITKGDVVLGSTAAVGALGLSINNNKLRRQLKKQAATTEKIALTTSDPVLKELYKQQFVFTSDSNREKAEEQLRQDLLNRVQQLDSKQLQEIAKKRAQKSIKEAALKALGTYYQIQS